MFQGRIQKVSRPELTRPDASASESFGARARTLAQRIRRRTRPGFPVRDTPHYVPDMVSNALAQLGLRKQSVWGPRIPGLRRLMATHPLIEVAALQWRACVEHTRNFLAAHPEIPSFTVRFEELCARPQDVTGSLFAFCELDPASVADRVAEVLPATPRAFSRALSIDELGRVEEHLAATLADLGYAL